MTDTSIEIALVVAAAENGVIGRDGGLPWHVSSDLKFFRKTTLGKPIVMGRKTFEAIGRPLDGRPNLVVSRDAHFYPDGALAFPTLEDALDVARTLAADLGQDEVAVIGGAQIYAATLGLADRIYLTRIHSAPEGDAHLAPLDDEVWTETSRERFAAGPKDDHDYSIIVMERAAAG
ncbi:MAG: dihydrofolate reductase, partial [Pseudomonadota bacterium]